VKNVDNIGLKNNILIAGWDTKRLFRIYGL